MSRFSYFQRANYNAPTKNVLLVKNFVGIDVLNAQNNVSTQRGIYSLNYVWLDNVAQKRWAYDKIAFVKKTYFYPIDYDTNAPLSNAIENPNQFNGLWSFIADDGNRHYIAHIGHLLYEVRGIDTERPTFSPIFEVRGIKENCSYKFHNQHSFAAVGQKRLWFLGGERFVMLHYHLVGDTYYPMIEQVAYSDYAFVPTTTVAITTDDAITSGRTGMDYPNLMSKFRINTLLSGVERSEGENRNEYYEYTLDAPIVWQDETEDMFDMTIDIDSYGILGE